MAKRLDKRSALEKLNAVKTGNAHEVDDAIWTTAGGVKAAYLFLDDIEKYF